MATRGQYAVTVSMYFLMYFLALCNARPMPEIDVPVLEPSSGIADIAMLEVRKETQARWRRIRTAMKVYMLSQHE